MKKITKLVTLLCTAGLAIQAAADIRQGLVAYWPLDTTDGTTTPDVAFGNHLDLYNMDASNLVEGRRGQAFSFNGTDQYLARLADLTNPDARLPISRAPRFTVSLWVNGNFAGQNDRRAFSEASTTSNNPLFNIGTHSSGANASADIYIRTAGGTASVNHLRSAQPAFNGEWHNITWVDNNGDARMYVDGVLDSTNFKYTRGTIGAETTSIGAILRAGPLAFFSGAVDDVAVWDRLLSADEVQQFVANGIQTPIPSFPPLITAQPRSSTNSLGENYNLSVSVGGEGPFTYQWLRNGQPIPDATSATFQVTGLTPATAATYSVSISNPHGTVTSESATITVNPDGEPNLREGLVSYWPLNEGDTTNPELVTTPDLYSGNSFVLQMMDETNFTPGRTGNALSFDGFEEYSTRTNGLPIYNNTAYTVSFWVMAEGLGQADRRVYAESSSTNNNPLFNLGTDNTGGSQSLDVYIRGTSGAVMIDHRKSRRAVFDNAWHHVAWVDQNGRAKLYIDGVVDETDFSYTRGQLALNTTALGALVRAAVAAHFTGSVDEVAVWNRALTFTEVQQVMNQGVPAPLAAIAPAIASQPAGAARFEGESLSLAVEATGTSPLTYQWLKNGEPIANATNNVLDFANISATHAGRYSVRIQNQAGSVTSSEADVQVTPVTGIDTALVARWPFETVANGLTPDIANGLDLSLRNMDENNLVEGRFGNALSFDGVDEILTRVHTNNASGLPITQHRVYTVAFWVKGFGPGQVDRRVFSEASTSNAQPLFNIGTHNLGNDGTVDILIREDNGATTVNHAHSIVEAYDDAWHHVVVAQRDGQIAIYIDGVLDETIINYNRGVFTANTTSVGGILRAAASHFFTGVLDEVAVWKRALTQDEITRVFNHEWPANPDPRFTIQSITKSGNRLELLVETNDPSATYTLQQTASLTDRNWSAVPNVTWSSAGANQLRAVFDAPAATQFYRVAR